MELLHALRYFLRLSYDGGPYNGWQKQANTQNTVQAHLDAALHTLLGMAVKTSGQGRTDTGVHARTAYAHFDLPDELAAFVPGLKGKPRSAEWRGVGMETEEAEVFSPESRLVYRLNKLLPPSIAVQACRAVHPEAHARFNATGRAYAYRIHTHKDPLSPHSAQVNGPLDVRAMQAAAALLVGQGDYSAFCKAGAASLTGICDVRRSEWMVEANPLEASIQFGQRLTYYVEADRFLRGMVRALVGTLLLVGERRQPIGWVADVLSSLDRSHAGSAAPPQGLTLERVTYPDWVWDVEGVKPADSRQGRGEVGDD